MSGVVGGLDRVEAVFDEGALVADAGLLAVGTLADRLGLEGLIDDTVREVFLTFRDSSPVFLSSIGVLAVVVGWSW